MKNSANPELHFHLYLCQSCKNFKQNFALFTEGSIVKGRIIQIRDREVLVDIGYKSEGAIPKSEFEEPEKIKIGDEIQVYLNALKMTKVWSFSQRESRSTPKLGTHCKNL
ncbi:MAG: S1 RNA-binding domain-containing protein [Verrucomicrobiia bacterium]